MQSLGSLLLAGGQEGQEVASFLMHLAQHKNGTDRYADGDEETARRSTKRHKKRRHISTRNSPATITSSSSSRKRPRRDVATPVATPGVQAALPTSGCSDVTSQTKPARNRACPRLGQQERKRTKSDEDENESEEEDVAPSPSSSSPFLSRRAGPTTRVLKPHLLQAAPAAVTFPTDACQFLSPVPSPLARTASFESVPALHRTTSADCPDLFELEGFDYHYDLVHLPCSSSMMVSSPLPSWPTSAASSAPSSPHPQQMSTMMEMPSPLLGGRKPPAPSSTSTTSPSRTVSPSFAPQQEAATWTLPSRPTIPGLGFCEFFASI